MAASSTFVSSDGDGYELQMGRWSRRLAPLFIDFAGITGARARSGCRVRHGQSEFRPGAESGNRQRAGHRFLAGLRRACEPPKQAMLASRFEVGDACALPFPDASFDHSLSMLVLQFIPQADLAVREMRRVTRPGGTVAAATWDTRGGLHFLSHDLRYGGRAGSERQCAQSESVHETNEPSRRSGASLAGRRIDQCGARHADDPHGLRILCGLLGAG